MASINDSFFIYEGKSHLNCSTLNHNLDLADDELGTPFAHMSFGVKTSSGFVQVIKTDPIGYESEFGPFIGYNVTCVGNFTPIKDAIWVYTVENCHINN